MPNRGSPSGATGSIWLSHSEKRLSYSNQYGGRGSAIPRTLLRIDYSLVVLLFFGPLSPSPGFEPLPAGLGVNFSVLWSCHALFWFAVATNFYILMSYHACLLVQSV